ncbi:ABC transporter ATP-binding protein [Anaerococcus sp. AGMB09787]|uniref:ATP-binding cassette domain-containing protein n=1 Tax=Anaerococcus sp. AGMB09787 TaxID=2922869 RepID=UPI001FAF61D9|nr:ABC transporter ATP-binding protein [Anaerococcus sp. AGMB09787]
MKKYLLKRKNTLIVYIIISLIASSIIVGTAFVYQRLTTYAMDRNFKKLLFIAAFSVPFFILDACFDYLPKKYISKLTHGIINDLRKDILAKVNKDQSYLVNVDYRARVNELIINDLETGGVYVRHSISLFLYISFFVFSLLSAMSIQVSLTLIMLVLSFIPLLSPFISKEILANKKEIQLKEKNKFLGSFGDYLGNLLYIKISDLGKIFLEKLYSRSDKLTDTTIDYETSIRKTYAVSYGLGNILYSGTYVIGGVFVYMNKLTLPSLIAITTLMRTIAGPIQTISDTYSNMVAGKKVFNDILAYINSESPRIDDEGEEICDIDSLEIAGADIGYGKNKVLENISYTFNKDKKYVIVGESGSGKSSLLNLILLNFEGVAEKIRVNEKSLDIIKAKSYYDKISYIKQDTAIFHASIMDNISLFSDDKDPDRARLALEEVGLSYWLKSKNNDLSELISKDELSGGEKKRFDLARAIYQDKPIIIMDEVDSGLDYENQVNIGKIIQNIRGKIIISVSHSQNPSFIEVFDTVLAIDKKSLHEVK